MEDKGDCINEKNDEFMEHAHRFFMEKEQLIFQSKCEFRPDEDGNEAEHDGHGFETILWMLRAEMIKLMQCDVQLWKQLTALYSSISALEENIRTETLYRESSASFSSASSETGSFVSAEEYNEVCPLDYARNRVLSWINQCEQVETVLEDNNEEQQIISSRPRSRTHNDIYSRRKDKNSPGDFLFKPCITAKSLNSSRADIHTYSFSYSRDLWNSGISGVCLVTVPRNVCNMKSLEEREIVSEKNFRYYKSSLRLLGSIRMQSRIFEPSLTKWRPFALSQSSDSFIIVPPTAFSNIQPRPKLRTFCNVFGSKTVQFNDEKHVHNVGNEVKESGGRLDIEIHRENTEAGKINNTKQDGNDLQIPIYVREGRENVAENWNIAIPLSEVNGDTEETTESPSGSKDQLDGTNTSENATESASDTESELLNPSFLEVKDGLITCRIINTELEDLNQAVTEQDEFEYLVIVDGRVTFTPHTRDNDKEEPYFLGWLFENTEFENNEDSFFIHRLFEETDSEKINTNLIMTKESYYVRHLFKVTDKECVEPVTNDECDASLYISHLFEDTETETETVTDEFWDSCNISQLFQQPDTSNEIPNDVHKVLHFCVHVVSQDFEADDPALHEINYSASQ